MKMKKLLFAAALVVSAAACSTDVTTPEQRVATPAAARANASSNSPAPDSTSEPKEVGVVGPGGG